MQVKKIEKKHEGKFITRYDITYLLNNGEEKVYDFADAGSSQTYWLARSFVVLGDSFVERGELKQTKATFESVRDGYTPQSEDDDVLENINLRLSKLEELINEGI